MRHFINKYEDLAPGARVKIDRDHWTRIIAQLCQAIQQNFPPSLQHCDGGLYTGSAGVGYMFYHLARSSVFNEKRDVLLNNAQQYIDVALEYCESRHNRDPAGSLLVGAAGVYAVAGLTHAEAGRGDKAMELVRKFATVGTQCIPRDYLGCGSDEYLLGRVGYLCGAHQIIRKLGQGVSADLIKTLCSATVESGRVYSRRHKAQSPLMYSYHHTQYLGAAHGLSSILQILLCFPDFIKSDPSIEKDVHDAVDFLLAIMQENGNLAPSMDEVAGPSKRADSEELIHWCHGAPGVVYLFAKAWLFWKEEKYLSACYRCGEVTWRKGLLRKGAGICHGIAGNGYVFLLLYRLTADQKHLHRALKFAEFLQTQEFHTGARTPDAAFSLYEGWAGTACFLADLLQPHQAEFPLFDVI